MKDIKPIIDDYKPSILYPFATIQIVLGECLKYKKRTPFVVKDKILLIEGNTVHVEYLPENCLE